MHEIDPALPLHHDHQALESTESAGRYRPRHRATRADRLDPARRPVARRLAAGALTGVALGTVVTAVAPAAPAMADHDRFGDPSEGERPAPSGSRALGIAASQAGTPYAWGGDGPGGFDCSGFTSWVWSRLGHDLPRTSAAQAGATRRIAARDARPGDLVFFTGGGGVYHVGIYAGGGAVWHAPRPGEGVQRDRIWTSSVFYGRVR